MPSVIRGLGCQLLLAGLLVASLANAAPIRITVNTTSLASADALLAFDLIDGGPPPNVVTITSFTTDGMLGGASGTAGVSGSFPGTVTLADTEFFNEYLQGLTLGTTFSFIFDTTGNTASPPSLPDGFSLFLLDAMTGFSLITTNDPTGADALLLFNIGAANPLAIYSGGGVTVTAQVIGGVPVPAPATLLLVVTALAVLSLARLGPLTSRRTL